MNEYVSLINSGVASPIMCNHKARYNNDRDIEIFGRMNPGDKSDDPKIADIMPYKSRSDIFRDKYLSWNLTRMIISSEVHIQKLICRLVTRYRLC